MGQSAGEAFQYSNISATTAAFNVSGGRYVLSVAATWGGGTVKLQVLAFDGTTYVDVANSSLTANGITGALELPPGTYKINVATASAIYATLTRIPQS